MERRIRGLLIFLSVVVALIIWLFGGWWAPVQKRTLAQAPDPTMAVYLPLIVRLEPPPTETPECLDGATEDAREWDSRLDLRAATLISATVMPGKCYWRLIKAVWYDEEQSQGRHHIFVDTRDGQDQRQIGVRIEIGFTDGPDYIVTEAKPGEQYAKDYAMFAHAPAYSARPDGDAPADKVDGMGLGSIDQPNLGIHTSYGLIWRWTLAPPLPMTPSPTSTVAITLTVTPTGTASITPTVTVTPTTTTTGTTTIGGALMLSPPETSTPEPAPTEKQPIALIPMPARTPEPD